MSSGATRQNYTGVDDARVQTQHEVGSAAFGIYCGLARHADKQGRCSPSVALLASYLQCNERTVTRAVARLESAEWICVERRNGAVNQYAILSPRTTDTGVTPSNGTPDTSVTRTTDTRVGRTTDTSVTLSKPSEVNPGSTPKEGAFVLANDPEKSTELDVELLAWLAWWNELHRAGLVTSGVGASEPSKVNVAAWARSQRNREAVEALADRAALRQAIEDAPFAQGGWFTLARLLGGTNQDGELIAAKLLRGGFKDGRTNGKVGGAVRSARSVARVSQRYGPK